MSPSTPSTPTRAFTSQTDSVQTIISAHTPGRRPHSLWLPDSRASPSEFPTAVDRHIYALEDTESVRMLVDRLSRASFRKYYGDGTGALDLVRSSTYEFGDDHEDVREGKDAYDDDYELLSKAVQLLLTNDKVDKHGRMMLRDILRKAETWKESRKGSSLVSRARQAFSKPSRHV